MSHGSHCIPEGGSRRLPLPTPLKGIDMRNHWMPLIGVTATMLLWSPGPSFAAENGSAFLKEAIRGDIAETKIGELAQKQAGSADVKAFGQELTTDHGQHLTQVETLAKSMNVTVPTKPKREATEEYNKLSKLSGKAFDQEFVSYMVKDHKEDIAKYQKEAQGGDAEIAALAKKTLPTLQKHLETAQSLQSKVGTQTSQ
jgi:putative membrane protein